MADGNLEFNTKLDSSGFSGGIATLGKLTAVGLTAIAGALGAGAGAVIKFGSEFESGMAKVSTLVDTSTTNMKELSKGILEVSSASGTSATELSEAMYQSISAGVKGTEKEIVAFVEQANKLSTAGFTSTASAVDLVTTALNGYKLGTEEAENVSDQLIMTQNLGKTTVDELASSMGRVIPTASAFGVNLGNVNASLATMTASGIGTAEATTYLKGMIAELGKDGSEVADILKQKTGKSFSQLMNDGYSLGDVMGILGDSVGGNADAFANLWASQEAGTGALAIMNAGTQQFNDTLGQITGTAGATEDAYGKMMDTFDKKVDIMIEGTKNFGISLYDGMQEPLKGLADVGIESIGKLKESFEKEGLQGMLNTGSQLLVQLLNGILQKLPDVINTASGIITTILTTITEMAPTIAESGAQILTQLVTALLDNLPILLECAVELLIAFANGIAEQLPTLIPVAIQAIINLANTLLENLPRILEAGKNLLLGLIDGIFEAIPTLIANIPTIIVNLIQALFTMLPQILSAGAEILVHLISGIASMLGSLGAMAMDIIGKLWDTIINTDWIRLGIDIINFIVGGIANMIGSLASIAGDIVSTIINTLASLPSKMWDIGSNIIGGIWDGISGGVGWLMDKISGFVDDVVDGICDFFDIFSPSHRMRDEVGKYLPSGIAVGYEKAMPEATDDMIDATDSGFKDLQKSAFEMSNKVTLQPQATSPDNQNNDFDYERLGKEVAKNNDKVIVMDSKEVGKTVTDTVDKQIGKETIKKGRYRA